MTEEIKFDYSKAQSILDILNECKRGIDELSIKMSNEVAGVGQWWKGEAYDAFRERYDGSGNLKSNMLGLAEKASDTIIQLGKISDAKKANEVKVTGSFR